MVEAVNIKTLNIISPFDRSFGRSYIAEIESCPITSLYTEYVDVMNHVCSRNIHKKWTPTDVDSLRRDLLRFKSNRVRVFKAYQKSEMGTIKFHILDHVADYIVRDGGLFSFDEGVSDYSHIIFQQMYQKASKSRIKSMDD